MAESRRIRMTKTMIRDALIDLLNEQPLEKISITDICERADVNRSTFYAHYDDVSALMRDAEDDALAHVPVTQTMPSLSAEDAMMKKLIVFLQYIRANDRLFRILILQADRSSFNQRLTQMLLEQYRPLIRESDRWKFGYAFYMNGVIGLLREWVSSSFSPDEASLAHFIVDMALAVFRDSE